MTSKKWDNNSCVTVPACSRQHYLLKLTKKFPLRSLTAQLSTRLLHHLLKSFVILSLSFTLFSLSYFHLFNPLSALAVCEFERVEVIVGLVNGAHSWNSISVRSLLGACHQDHTEEKRHPHS